jgi:protein-tyrosine phosphatase
MKKVSVLFVCTGNICRSPTAEGVFAHLVRERGFADRIDTDSAGTIDYHAGEAPDHRAQETALRYGVDIGDLRARQVSKEDYTRFHYILAMDREHLRLLRLGQPKGHDARVQLFCEYTVKRRESEVPDPYYGGPRDFEDVFALVRDASEGLLEAIVAEHFAEDARSHRG